jgi:heat-inducible transcriptional repressor
MTDDDRTSEPILTQRREQVLRFVVEEHIASGVPVGSKTLATAGGFAFAPSTLRYDLAWLERSGLLDHPHTSAGRVPTEEGYRYYARLLLAERRPAEPPPVDLTAAHQEIDAALRATTEALAQVTNLLALATAPPLSTTTIRHVEVLLLQPQVVMVVVITAAGGVAKRIFAFEEPVDPGLAEWARAYLNETLAGTAIGTHAVRRRLLAPELAPREHAFLAAVGPVFSDVIDENAGDRVYLGGASRLISELRAREVGDLHVLAAALEERATMIGMLRDALAADRVLVRIGAEHPDPRVRPLALVASSYGIGARNLGAVSLLGPVRMDYARAIPTVRAAAAALSEFIGEVYG